MSRVGKATTMSVPEMRELLGLKKTESYWLLKKNYFEVVLVGGKMRIVIASFEEWYDHQVHYHKVNGAEPGAKLKLESISTKDIAEKLGISTDTVLGLIKREGLPYTICQNGQWRVSVTVFESWYTQQSHYRNQADRKRDKVLEECSMTIPEFGRSIGLDRETTYRLVRKLKEHLKFVTIAGQKRVTIESIQQWDTLIQHLVKGEKADVSSSKTGDVVAVDHPQDCTPNLGAEAIGSTDKLTFSIREAATILDIQEKTLYRMINNNEIDGMRIGNQWRIQRNELQRWIREEQALDLQEV